MKISKEDLNKIGLLYLVGRCKVIQSRIRLQKLVCLTKYKYKEEGPFSFDFCSYFYGPYSDGLRECTEQLIQDGLLLEEMIPFSNDKYSYNYRLSDIGKKHIKNLIEKEEIRKLLTPIDKILTEYSTFPTETIVKKAKEVSGIQSMGQVF